MGLKMIRTAQKHVLKQEVIVDSQERLKTAINAPKGVYRYDPVKAYQNQLRTLVERYGTNLDLSRADFAICKAMAKQGYSADQLEQTLHQASPELPKRKLGHEQDYCSRTVKAAFLDKEVNKYLEKQKSKSHSYGHSL
jgi:monomeric isocitrate dehydrogenase